MLSLADDTVHALNRSQAAAARDGAEAVEPKHILAGLVSQNDPVLRELMEALSLSPEDLPTEYRDLPRAYEGHFPYSQAAQGVLTEAVEFGTEAGHDAVTTVHLLLGVVRSEDLELQEVLAPWSLDQEALAQEVERAVAG